MQLGKAGGAAYLIQGLWSQQVWRDILTPLHLLPTSKQSAGSHRTTA